MTQRTGLIGTKIGNSSYFDESGKALPVTLVRINDCVVSDVKSYEKNISLSFFITGIFDISYEGSREP